jgi:hypothetical protein
MNAFLAGYVLIKKDKERDIAIGYNWICMFKTTGYSEISNKDILYIQEKYHGISFWDIRM